MNTSLPTIKTEIEGPVVLRAESNNTNLPIYLYFVRLNKDDSGIIVSVNYSYDKSNAKVFAGEKESCEIIREMGINNIMLYPIPLYD